MGRQERKALARAERAALDAAAAEVSRARRVASLERDVNRACESTFGDHAAIVRGRVVAVSGACDRAPLGHGERAYNGATPVFVGATRDPETGDLVPTSNVTMRGAGGVGRMRVGRVERTRKGGLRLAPPGADPGAPNGGGAHLEAGTTLVRAADPKGRIATYVADGSASPYTRRGVYTVGAHAPTGGAVKIGGEVRTTELLRAADEHVRGAGDLAIVDRVKQ